MAARRNNQDWRAAGVSDALAGAGAHESFRRRFPEPSEKYQRGGREFTAAWAGWQWRQYMKGFEAGMRKRKINGKSAVPARKAAPKRKWAPKRKAAPKRRNGSELEGAAAMYRKFHGRPASGVRTVKQLRVQPSTLADLGRLVDLVIDTGNGGRRLTFGPGVRVATTGDGGQLYFVGGDQAVNLDGWPGVRLPKDQVRLGEVVKICYHTTKDFHDFEPSDYEHEFGETGRARPVLGYDVHSARLYLVGGGYQVKRPGIVD